VDQHEGRPLRLDGDAASTDPNVPAFLARPEGAPVYHGFPILGDVEVDGFCLGMITDWESGPSDSGDAFVVAPDDSRAGLVWEIGPEPMVEPILEPDDGRWAFGKSRSLIRCRHVATHVSTSRRWCLC
jgi:hypothetical protein